jgi:hypothetical protein
MLPVIPLHTPSRTTKMAGVGAHRCERPSTKLDPPWRPRQVQTRRTSTPIQPRHLYVERYTSPTRVSRLRAPTFRSLRSVGPLTQPSLRFPHVYGAQGARRRRSGGGPGGGCSRRPVGTYLYLHAVGAGSPIAVPCVAR